MDYRLLLKTSVSAGEILLESGAETRRVQDTMKRILSIANMKHAEAIVVSMSIIATLSDDNFLTQTEMSHINERGSCFIRICQVNAVSRKLCSGEMNLEEAYEEIEKIRTRREYNAFLISLSMVAIGALYPFIINGSCISSIISLFNGVITSFFKILCDKMRFNVFITNMVVSFMGTIIPLFILPLFGDGFETEIIITAAIMPLVPGVAITNAVRDTLGGDFVSGGARVLEAFVKAFSIALGVAIGLLIFT